MHTFRHTLLIENISDFSHAVHHLPAFGHHVQGGICRRCDRIVSSVRCPFPFAVLHDIRTGNDSAAGPVTHQKSACSLADFIKLLQRNHIEIGCNLKYAVCRGIYDWFAGGFMLRPKFFNDFCPRGRIVAQTLSSDLRLKGSHKFCRKTLRICFERYIRPKSCNFPVTCSGILPTGKLGHLAVTSQRLRSRQPSSADTVNISETQLQQVRDRKAPAGFPDMTESICPCIAVCCSIRQRPHT